jgi:hypothetical protein
VKIIIIIICFVHYFARDHLYYMYIYIYDSNSTTQNCMVIFQLSILILSSVACITYMTIYDMFLLSPGDWLHRDKLFNFTVDFNINFMFIAPCIIIIII